MRNVRRGLAGGAVAAALTLGVSAATADAGPRLTEPSLVGATKLRRADGQDVRFAIDAHGLGEAAHGTLHISHRDGEQFAWFSGTVHCLVVGGPVAVLTGVVTDTNLPQFKGVRRGITVYDNGKHDRLGYSWLFNPGDTTSVPKCLSNAPFETVESGDFTAVEWLPPF